MTTSDSQISMYLLLRRYAYSQEVLSFDEIHRVTNWTRGTFDNTYYGKMYRDFMTKCEGGYKVHTDFARVTQEDFRAHVTQSRSFYGKYRQVSYSRTIIYEFLLPLTREDKLRRSLDELFFKNTLDQRYSEIDEHVLQQAISRNEKETDSSYRDRVLTMLGNLIGGYSIGHVQGRYRALELMSQQEAAKRHETQGQQYLHDETTASVRFIIPCLSSRGRVSFRKCVDESEAWEQDIKLVRTLFFEFFVEAIIKTIRGEDEIWLIETSDIRRLFVFEKTDT